MRTIVVGDIHGCSEELRALTEELHLNRGDRVVCVGDFLDKGPDPVGCVQFARQMGFEAVLGNHEEKALRWLRHDERSRHDQKYRNPMKPVGELKASQWRALSDEDVSWLRDRPIMMVEERLNSMGWVIVHGGLMPGVALEDQTDDRLRVRWVDADGRMLSLDPEDPRQPEGGRPWMEVYDGHRSVVYGHAAHHLRTPRVDRNSLGAECWGIDTGCAYGGHLTALVLESREVIQVRAREAYATPPFPIPS